MLGCPVEFMSGFWGTAESHCNMAWVDSEAIDPNRPFDDQICRTARQHFTGNGVLEFPSPS
jgi:hypothetical protein